MPVRMQIKKQTRLATYVGRDTKEGEPKELSGIWRCYIPPGCLTLPAPRKGSFVARPSYLARRGDGRYFLQIRLEKQASGTRFFRFIIALCITADAGRDAQVAVCKYCDRTTTRRA